MDQRIEGYYRQHRLEGLVGAAWLDQFRLRHFAKGAAICELEQPVEALYFFVEGRAKVFLPAANGRQLLLCFYEPLQILGDLEIFEPEPRATTTVAAVTPCVCLALPRQVVLTHLAADPLFMKQLYRSLSRKLGRVIQNSALNLLHPLENRVASYILATATPAAGDQLLFSGNLTHIADLLGTTFRHLHRTLQAFCDQEILVKTQTGYRISHIAELENRAAGVYVLT